MLTEMKTAALAIRDRFMTFRGQRDSTVANIQRLETGKAESEENQQIAKEAVVLLEFASQSSRENVKSKIDNIVTFALQSVFGPGYRFETRLENKRNAVHADFVVISDDYNEGADPLESRGGGVVDIVSLALRIVFLELYVPGVKCPILLDEPTKQLSREYAGKAAELLSAFAQRTGRQIILVTHDQTLAKEAVKRFEM